MTRFQTIFRHPVQWLHDQFAGKTDRTDAVALPSPAAVSPLVKNGHLIKQLDFERLPVFSAAELIQQLDLGPLLAAIRRHVSVSDQYWLLLYQPAIERYLEYCQLAPASSAHHHAGPGGLAVHTIEALDIALKKRRNKTLATVTGPEIEKREEHVWTYAVFAAVLLHDVGKLATSTVLIPLDSPTGEAAVPFHKTLFEQRVVHYRVEFRMVRGYYKLHTRIAPAAMHILPQMALAWLAQSPPILGQLMAYLSNDFYEAGPIGELALNADQESTAANLKIGGDRHRFPNAPAVPLVDHVLIALRELIARNEIRHNQNGGAIWTDEHFAYAVCGTIASKVIDALHSQGVPTSSDNNRVFDLLQEHGFIHCTPKDRAIWTIEVASADNAYKHRLTVLKFDVWRLYPPFRKPEPFNGSISILDDANAPSAFQVTIHPKTTTPSPASISSPHESSDAYKLVAVAAINTENLNTDSVIPLEQTVSSFAPTISEFNSVGAIEASEMVQSAPVSFDTEASNDDEDDPFAQERKRIVLSKQQTNNSIPLAVSASQTPLTTRLSPIESKPSTIAALTNGLVAHQDLRPAHIFDDKIGELFIDWLARSVQSKEMRVNCQDARVHVVPEGVSVITPVIFRDYITTFDLLRGESERLTIDQAMKHVQRRMERTKRLIKTSTGSNLHKYLIKGDNRSAKINVYLFEPAQLYGVQAVPEPNKFVIKL